MLRALARNARAARYRRRVRPGSKFRFAVALLALYCAVCQAGRIDCFRGGVSYQPTQPWPYDSIEIDATVARPCFGGFVPVCSDTLPRLIGGTVQVDADTIVVDVYGADNALSNGIPLLASPPPEQYFLGIPLAAVPLAPGVYSLALRVHNVDAQGNDVSCSGGAAYPSTVTIRAANGPVERLTAVEFYNASLDHYFVTADAGEIADLDRGVHPGWVRTGGSFSVFAPGKSGGTGVPVCRFYGLPSAGLDSHFYTANAAECAEIPTKYRGAWQLETADAFEVWLPTPDAPYCDIGSAEIFRLWNQRVDSNHRFTADGNVLVQMLQRGYVAEGVGSPIPAAMCAP